MGIRIYGQDDCNYCDELREYYARQGVPSEYINLSAPYNAQLIKRFREKGLLSTPIVETPTETWSGRQKYKEVKSVQEYRAEEAQRQEQQRIHLEATTHREQHL